VAAAPRIEQRFSADSPIAWTAAVAEYDGRMKDIIHALKYDRRRTISPRLGAAMKETAAALLRDAACVVPVPLHPRREYVRGFNQARDLARHLGLPVVEPLARAKHTRSQIDLPRDQRRANVADAFVWRTAPLSRLPPLDLTRGGSELVEGPVPGIVVLVDDVSTTGATLESCAGVLKLAGVTEVRAVTAARVVNAPR
jgi:predicted amidophosphoribosyltransferase